MSLIPNTASDLVKPSVFACKQKGKFAVFWRCVVFLANLSCEATLLVFGMQNEDFVMLFTITKANLTAGPCEKRLLGKFFSFILVLYPIYFLLTCLMY